ncbi:MAG TPA: Lin0512 family protein [Bacillales bacterium]
MEKVLFIETGTGIDIHGQNVTTAAERAVKNAVHANSMPGIESALPDQSLDNMQVHVKLAVPCDKDKLDYSKVKELIPYGTVTVETLDGGMLTTSGIVLEDQEDESDLMYMVNAAVEVGY